MKILVTAFEPFGKREINASLSVLDGIRELEAEHKIFKEVLPVDHTLAPQKLRTYMDNYSPDAVICLGEAGGIDWVQLEHVAINWLDFRIPDNSGVKITDKKISEVGETAYFSSLPLRLFERTLTRASLPVKVSMSAGTFLCNQIFYVLMESVSLMEKQIPAGFIHLPATMVGEENIEQECKLGDVIEGMNLIVKDLFSYR